MKVSDMMTEYDLGIDDVRWHLASEQAERLLQYRDRPYELTRLVWSGALEAELYDMEERFLRNLQEELDRNLRDVTAVRNALRKVAASRQRRYSRD
ncbi:MAG: hypothetical protein JW820_00160 [Spirochaetales bacterium]|nr:hypothetical protein [Spirochaetales bacterium]